MNDKNFESYKDRFYNGKLNSKEESEFRKLVEENPNHDNLKFQVYFSLNDQDSSHGFLSLSKESFFQKIELNQKSKRHQIYYLAASFIGLLLVAIILFSQQKKSHKSISKAEIDQSIEITRLALNSFSTNMSKGLQKAEKAMDFHRPYHSLSNLSSHDQKK